MKTKMLCEEQGICNPCLLNLDIPVVTGISSKDLEIGNENCERHQWELQWNHTCRVRPSLWFWDCQLWECSKCKKIVLLQDDLGDMGFMCGKDNPY